MTRQGQQFWWAGSISASLSSLPCAPLFSRGVPSLPCTLPVRAVPDSCTFQGSRRRRVRSVPTSRSHIFARSKGGEKALTHRSMSSRNFLQTSAPPWRCPQSLPATCPCRLPRTVACVCISPHCAFVGRRGTPHTRNLARDQYEIGRCGREGRKSSLCSGDDAPLFSPLFSLPVYADTLGPLCTVVCGGAVNVPCCMRVERDEGEGWRVADEPPARQCRAGPVRPGALFVGRSA